LIGIAVAVYGINNAASTIGALHQKEKIMEMENSVIETKCEEPRILEEIQVEELAIDGICGVY
jgi:mycofactocin precursor